VAFKTKYEQVMEKAIKKQTEARNWAEVYRLFMHLGEYYTLEEEANA